MDYESNKIAELNSNRREDLKKLVLLRNKNNYKWEQEEIRNCLFVFASFVSSENEEEAIKDFIDFSNELDNKSSNFYKRLVSAIPHYCRYFKITGKNRYKFSNSKIIEMLKIDKFEELYILDYIISEEILQERERLALERELEKIKENDRIEREIDKSLQNYQEDFYRDFKDPFLTDKTEKNPFE